jgi:mono/diheme cytochrome c family protein
MTEDRTGRELEPRPEDRAVTPVLERPASVERFDAGAQAHTVGLSEERAAQIVRQSGNARTVGLLAALVVALFIPIYWFYDIGIAALGVQGRLPIEAEVQYVTDVERGYALYLANCARCHGQNGEGGIGPPLNDQDKLYNALTADRQPGTGHLNPNYIDRVLEVGGRYVCGDPNSVMPAWKQPAGPLNYREVEELIAFLTASSDIEIHYDPGAHGEGAADAEATPYTVTGWRDPNYQPPPGQPTPPACWRPYSNPAFPAPGAGQTAAPIESPGTAEDPREIAVVETTEITITDPEGGRLEAIAVVPGEVVTFEVTNEADFPHNFFIGEPQPLENNAVSGLPGIPDFQSDTQTFEWEVPDDPSGLQYACTIPGHYGTMHGDFVVVEPGGSEPGASPGTSPEASPGASPSAPPGPGTSPEGTAVPSPSGSPQPSPLATEPSATGSPAP